MHSPIDKSCVGWEKKLLKTKLYLKHFFINNFGTKITDFKSLYLFVKKQQPGFKLVILNARFENEELYRYFKPKKMEEKPEAGYMLKVLKLVNK
uniref:Uncharacterized protein n=1 Tax=Panagrolaimus sp. JU765 TaxID=591449 RepID=A0AC34QCE9_9BILA